MGVTYTTGYSYDPGDRLIGITLPSGRSVSIDRDGARRVTEVRAAVNGSNSVLMTNAQYRGDNQLTQCEFNHTRTYNDANRLTEIVVDGVPIATYTYNAFGERTRKVLGTSTIIYHYDLSGNLIGESDESGSFAKDYIWTDGVPVAQIERNGADDDIYYLHTDHLATPRFATNASQQVVWRWEGRAFGDSAANDDADGNGSATTIIF